MFRLHLDLRAGRFRSVDLGEFPERLVDALLDEGTEDAALKFNSWNG
jgi:hypothetical protein